MTQIQRQPDNSFSLGIRNLAGTPLKWFTATQTRIPLSVRSHTGSGHDQAEESIPVFPTQWPGGPATDKLWMKCTTRATQTGAYLQPPHSLLSGLKLPASFLKLAFEVPTLFIGSLERTRKRLYK